MSTVEIAERLRRDLTVAMRARDHAAVRALRSALAALANAEAPALDGAGPAPTFGLVDHARLELTADDVDRILRAEVDERRRAVEEYRRIGRPEHAADVEAELAALEPYAG